MSDLQWKSDYETGIKSIDKDHKTLFSVVVSLAGQIASGDGPEDMVATVEELCLYAEEHFEREERYMRRAGFPMLKDHILEHDTFNEAVRCLRILMDREPERVEPQKVLVFLKKWLIDHIENSDQKYVPYLDGSKPGDEDIKTCESHRVSHLKLTIDVPADARVYLEDAARVLMEGGRAAGKLKESITELKDFRLNQELDYARRFFGK